MVIPGATPVQNLLIIKPLRPVTELARKDPVETSGRLPVQDRRPSTLIYFPLFDFLFILYKLLRPATPPVRSSVWSDEFELKDGIRGDQEEVSHINSTKCGPKPPLTFVKSAGSREIVWGGVRYGRSPGSNDRSAAG